VRSHLDAGADHVCVQILGGAEDDPALRELDGLASVLFNS
jgi:hypothetical protein